LRRRPDIRAAERELAAATARIGVATADLFPSVVLTTGIGVQHATQQGTTPYRCTVRFGDGSSEQVVGTGHFRKS
jgi:outer membrane protein TolC